MTCARSDRTRLERAGLTAQLASRSPQGQSLLLDDAHEEGGPKALFLRRFGFRDDAPYVLASALLRHPHPDILASQTISGRGDVKLIFEGPLASPDGRNPNIRTVRRIASDRAAHFVTAIPLGRD